MTLNCNVQLSSISVSSGEPSSNFHTLLNLVASRLLCAMDAAFRLIRDLTLLNRVVSSYDGIPRLIGNLVATWWHSWLNVPKTAYFERPEVAETVDFTYLAF